MTRNAVRIIAISTALDNWSPGPGPGPGPGGIVAKEAVALDIDGPPETDEVADEKGGGGGGAGDTEKSFSKRPLDDWSILIEY